MVQGEGKVYAMMKYLSRSAAAAAILMFPQIAGAGMAVAQPEPANISPAHFDTAKMDPAKGAVGSEPGRCLGLPGRPDLVVRATHLKNLKGTVRFVLYGNNPEEFLEKGKRLVRVEVPAKEGAHVCISLPHAGSYALAILHDVNGNGKFNLAADGGGFSNDPKIMFSQPSYAETAFSVTENGGSLDIRMRYLSGGK